MLNASGREEEGIQKAEGVRKLHKENWLTEEFLRAEQSAEERAGLF